MIFHSFSYHCPYDTAKTGTGSVTVKSQVLMRTIMEVKDLLSLFYLVWHGLKSSQRCVLGPQLAKFKFCTQNKAAFLLYIDDTLINTKRQFDSFHLSLCTFAYLFSFSFICYLFICLPINSSVCVCAFSYKPFTQCIWILLHVLIHPCFLKCYTVSISTQRVRL